MISFRGKFWLYFLRLLSWRLKSLFDIKEGKKQKVKSEFWRRAKNFNISDISYDNFDVIKFVPNNHIEGKIIIYLHGGAYVACGPDTHSSIVTQLSNYSKTTVLFPVYRLAPKYPFPAAIDDCLIVYKDLLEKGVEAKNISLVGDSAGGGLVMALLQILSKEKIDFPSSAILISPWTDLTLSGESMKERVGRDPMLHPGKEMDGVVKAYTGDEDPRNPLISSIFSNDLLFPPIQIHVGSEEVLYDDAIRLYNKIKQKDGNIVELREWDGLFHVFNIFCKGFLAIPEAKIANQEIVDFIKKYYPKK
jgi:acetyl esterase/lipase